LECSTNFCFSIWQTNPKEYTTTASISTISTQAKLLTNFLSIPREIRQHILLEAFSEEACILDLKYCNPIPDSSPSDLDLQRRLKLPTTEHEAHLLAKLHPIIKQDMVIILKIWKRWCQEEWPYFVLNGMSLSTAINITCAVLSGNSLLPKMI
jgi:hypothetical protein